jgi:dihydrofolate reductase
MGKVISDMSISLDGFIVGPNDGPENGLGDGGDVLHDWIWGGTADRSAVSPLTSATDSNRDVMDEWIDGLGAVIMGRWSFDIAEVAWGDTPPFHVPVFVLTHKPKEKLVKDGGTTFTFVTDGIESALRQAQVAAGDKNVHLHGASTAQQLLKAGLLDEIQVHLVPVLLGGGKRLLDSIGKHIELEKTRVIDSPGVTHLRFRVIKS